MAAHGRSLPRPRRKRRADPENRMDVANDDGATIALPLTTTVRSTRRWWRVHLDDPSLHAPCPSEREFGRSQELVATFGGGRVPKSLCCAALPANPRAGLVPAGAACADSHMPATQFCAARNPPSISSERRTGAPAAYQLRAAPPKCSTARSHCGRARRRRDGAVTRPWRRLSPSWARLWTPR